MKLKLLISIFVFFNLIAIAQATTINNTYLYSSGINTAINITQPSWILDNLTVDTNFIYIENLTSSNNNEVTNDKITFNLTEQNQIYTGTEVPYYSIATDYSRTLLSFITQTLPSQATMNVIDCPSINTVKVGSSSASWSCSNSTTLTLPLNISYGSNNINWGYNYTPYNCSSGNMIHLNIPENEQNFSYLPKTDFNIVFDYWTNPSFPHKNISYSTTAKYQYFDQTEKFKPDASTDHIYEDMYFKLQPLKQGYLTAYCNDVYTYDATGERTIRIYNSTGDQIAYKVATLTLNNYCAFFTQSDYSQIMKVGENYTVKDEQTGANALYVVRTGTPTTATYDSFIFYHYGAHGNLADNGYFTFYSQTNTLPDGICLDSGTITGDLYIKYPTENGFTHRFYLNNYTFNNNTQLNLTLFNYPTITDISELNIVVRDATTYNYYPNIYTTLMRYYPQLNIWKDVQMDKTGDWGNAIFHIQEQKTDYELKFQDYAGHILKITEPLKFTCEGDICSLTVLLTQYQETANNSELTLNYQYLPATHQIKTTWSKLNGSLANINIKVTKETMSGATDICSESYFTSSGTSYCNVSGYSGEVFVYLEGDNRVYNSEFVTLSEGGLSTYLSITQQVFFSFILLVVVFGMALFSATASIVLAIFGIIILYLTGLFAPINLTFVILIIIIGIAILMKVKNK